MLRYIHQSEKTSNNADHEDCRLWFFFFFLFFFVFSPNNSFVWTHIGILNTASKESEFGVFLVRMWENTNQTNSKHRHFSRSGKHSHNLTQQSWVLSVVILKKRHAQFKKKKFISNTVAIKLSVSYSEKFKNILVKSWTTLLFEVMEMWTRVSHKKFLNNSLNRYKI